MEARFSAPVQTGPGAHPATCTTGTGSFPGVKSGWGVTLTPHPLLVPWSWKRRAIPLLPLWAVRPVQNLSACTRVHFTLLLKEKLPPRGCQWYWRSENPSRRNVRVRGGIFPLIEIRVLLLLLTTLFAKFIQKLTR